MGLGMLVASRHPQDRKNMFNQRSKVTRCDEFHSTPGHWRSTIVEFVKSSCGLGMNLCIFHMTSEQDDF